MLLGNKIFGPSDARKVSEWGIDTESYFCAWRISYRHQVNLVCFGAINCEQVSLADISPALTTTMSIRAGSRGHYRSIFQPPCLDLDSHEFSVIIDNQIVAPVVSVRR